VGRRESEPLSRPAKGLDSRCSIGAVGTESLIDGLPKEAGRSTK
jgi:hypothetical protein